MRLAELLRRSGLEPAPRVIPRSPPSSTTSRRCRPGSLFVAVPGFHIDGHGFAADAVRAGAAAVVAERAPLPALPAAAPLLIVGSSRRALSALAASLAGHPSRGMTVAGITGTDGKTTTSTMLWAAWRAAGERAAGLTTVDTRIGDEIRPNPGT